MRTCSTILRLGETLPPRELSTQAAIGQADVEDLLHPDGWRETAESEKKSEQLGKYVGFVFSHFLMDRFVFKLTTVMIHGISLPCHQGDCSLAFHEKSASNLQ